ncbi:hypothetical protein CR513_44219, partial [Mucuna pruriens]
MEDETSGKESTLILGKPLLMTARTKINHPTEDHSLFGIDLLDEIVEEYLQPNSSSEDIEKFVESADESSCLMVADEERQFSRPRSSRPEKAESRKKSKSTRPKSQLAEPTPAKEDQTQAGIEINGPSRSDSEGALEANADSNPTRTEVAKSSRPKQPKAEIMSAHLVPNQDQVGQTDPSSVTEKSPLLPPPMELKTLSSHLKYAYLDREQQLPVIIANNLHQEQEDKLLEVLRQHKKEIGWKLADLPSINPSICMHRILMEEEIKPIRQQQRRLNLTLLDVVKKEVTKLLAAGIIYPISDS